MTTTAPRKPSGIVALVRAMTSWRTASVSLLSFSSGLPLGLVGVAIPDWMRSIGVDIRLVGLFSLTQAPWAFKVVWSPLMDRYVPPFWGRRRGWMAVAQFALAVLGLALAGAGSQPDAIWVVGALALAIAFASASQDIAIDAYAVDVLRPEEQGAAVGARTAVYRAAYAVSGGVAITMAAQYGWAFVNVLLALVYVPMLLLTWKAPEPEEKAVPPRSLREAVWEPFIGFLSRHRALEILAFVLLYKFADNLAQALTRPFLIDMGYSAYDRGVALATVALAATIAGSFVGGWITMLAGLGHSLWIFGLLQIFSNIGYYLIARAGAPNLPLMYAATSFELLTSGLGTGAFSVLLIRLTQKRFSATQYALFSSIFALPRLLSGPITGFAVDALGWQTFFLLTMLVGIPGLVMLARFVPPGVREPEFSVEEAPRTGEPLTVSGLITRGLVGTFLSGIAAFAIVALLAALKTMRDTPAAGFHFGRAVAVVLQPKTVADWVQFVGILVFAAIGGLFVAAALAARQERRQELDGKDGSSEFRELCAELTRSLLPALVSVGFVAPSEPFSRNILRYDFRRPTQAGTQTFSVVFNKFRHPQFNVQLFVEPTGGLADLQSRGGELLIGGVSPSSVRWPFGVRPFRASPSRLQRILRRPSPTPITAVQFALSLVPEVEEWWTAQRSSRHILTGRMKYVRGESAQSMGESRSAK